MRMPTGSCVGMMAAGKTRRAINIYGELGLLPWAVWGGVKKDAKECAHDVSYEGMGGCNELVRKKGVLPDRESNPGRLGESQES